MRLSRRCSRVFIVLIVLIFIELFLMLQRSGLCFQNNKHYIRRNRSPTLLNSVVTRSVWLLSVLFPAV